MAYAAISKPSLHFNTVTYTGNGSTQSITGVGFQPDWVWGKNRSATGSHNLCDVVRGVTKILYSNLTDAQGTDANSFTSFDSDGFSIGSQSNINGSGNSIVAWNWLADNTSGSANTDGSINSTVSVNTTAGFSIVKYTGTGSNATVGHGLGAVPGMILFKCTHDTQNWRVYHKGMDATAPEDYALILNNNLARDNDNTAFNDTAPTTTTFSLGTTATINQNGNIHIAYCFAEKKGYSKFGSYTGNGSTNGIFVYTGFKPAFVMIKRTDSTANWRMIDSKRNAYNILPRTLTASQNAVEYTGTDDFGNTDILSNGFKIRTSYVEANASGGSYIYMAFAEEPLVANVGASIPATAR